MWVAVGAWCWAMEQWRKLWYNVAISLTKFRFDHFHELLSCGMNPMNFGMNL